MTVADWLILWSAAIAAVVALWAAAHADAEAHDARCQICGRPRCLWASEAAEKRGPTGPPNARKPSLIKGFREKER
jgi:hypothetical protein